MVPTFEGGLGECVDALLEEKLMCVRRMSRRLAGEIKGPLIDFVDAISPKFLQILTWTFNFNDNAFNIDLSHMMRACGVKLLAVKGPFPQIDPGFEYLYDISAETVGVFFDDTDKMALAAKSAPSKDENERKEVAEAFRLCVLSIVDELLGSLHAELQRRQQWSTGVLDTDQTNQIPATADQRKRARSQTPEREDPLFAPEFSPQQKKRQLQKTAGELYVEQLTKDKTAEEGKSLSRI
jgi:hypothetical protein